MTAPLTPERLAEARHWVAQGGPIGGAVVHPLVRDLLAAMDAAEERAERAEGALARVEALAERWEREADADQYDPCDVAGRAAELREAMAGKP